MRGDVLNGYETSRIIRTFKSEGYRLKDVCRLVGVSRMTIWRHHHSCPVRRRTFHRFTVALSRLDSPDVPLTPQQRAVADNMLGNLGKDLSVDAAAWQDLKIRESDDYYA